MKKTDCLVSSASDSDIPSVLFQFAGCVALIRLLKSYSNQLLKSNY